MSSETRGTVWYGMHFYAGLAEYKDDKRPYRVFLNEGTIRSMDPTFAGCPVFVNHVDSVDPDLKKLRADADGFVSESFYNKSDGKHWVKFITVSDEATAAIKAGYRLSNCYVPKTFGVGGIWNGISYDKEITSGEYEHLALVQNPRYDESIIMTPAEFKQYNADKDFELVRLANTKDNIGEKPVKFSFFKRAKVDNSLDLETMSVELPLSKVEVSLSKLINEADQEEMEKDKPKIAEDHHLVNVLGETMSVKELVGKHARMCDEMEQMKKPKEEPKDLLDEEDDEEGKKDDSADDDDKYGDDGEKPEDDEREDDDKKIKMEEQEKQKNALELERAVDKVKANALRNVSQRAAAAAPGEKAVLMRDAMALGKKLF